MPLRLFLGCAVMGSPINGEVAALALTAWAGNSIVRNTYLTFMGREVACDLRARAHNNGAGKAVLGEYISGAGGGHDFLAFAPSPFRSPRLIYGSILSSIIVQLIGLKHRI